MKQQSKSISSAITQKYSAHKADAFSSFFDPQPDDDDKDDDDLQPELLLGGVELPPLERNTIRALVLLAWKAIDWKSLANQAAPVLEEAAKEGGQIGVKQVAPISSRSRESLEAEVPKAAESYAETRSANMAGLGRTPEGVLAADPSAHWPLTNRFKTDLLRTMQQAVEEDWTPGQLSAVIEASYALSDERAALVADVEVSDAQSAGQYGVWMRSNALQLVRWRTNPFKERVTDECDDYEAQGYVPLGHEFAPGIRCPRAHPFCNCFLEAKPQEPVQ